MNPLPCSSSPSLCIVVLSYNNAADTIECLESLFQQVDAHFQIVVIDNASPDNAPTAIAAAYPGVELVVLPENRGWAGGNNVGIRLALERGFDVVCLLNNDTVIQPHAIAKLLSAASSLGPCLLHPAIYYFDAPEEHQIDASRDADAQPAASSSPYPVYEVAFAYGACLLIHREILRAVGELDERFFLMLEETDYYHRTLQRGFLSYCCPSARILHKESRSLGGRFSPLKTYYSVRNQLLLAEKLSPSAAGLLQSLSTLFWTVATIARSVSRRHVSLPSMLCWLTTRDPFARAVRRGVIDYLFRRFGKLRASGGSAFE